MVEDGGWSRFRLFDVKIVAQLAELGTSLNLGESPGNRVGVLNLESASARRLRGAHPHLQSQALKAPSFGPSFASHNQTFPKG
jgi:hypothetical protein